jgi:hypothetical protein
VQTALTASGPLPRTILGHEQRGDIVIGAGEAALYDRDNRVFVRPDRPVQIAGRRLSELNGFSVASPSAPEPAFPRPNHTHRHRIRLEFLRAEAASILQDRQ